MKKKLLLALAMIVVVLASLVPAALATTEPGRNYYIDVVITDKRAVMTSLVGRRGWGAHWIVKNRSSKRHTFWIGGLHVTVKPGGKARVSAGLNARGQVPWHFDTYPPKSPFSGFFTII
jgi:hypothetical protein